MTALRREYLAALGLEPLVLRALEPVDDALVSTAAHALREPARDGAPAAVRADAAHPPGDRALAAPQGRKAAVRKAGVDAGDGLFSPRPARLQLFAAGLDGFTGPHAALLRSLVRALALSPADICFDARADVPVIAFAFASADVVSASALASERAETLAQVPAPAGKHADALAHVPALASLRNARAKRALWPTLRRLRRVLRAPA